MAKKKRRIDFKGPSASELGLVVNTPEEETQETLVKTPRTERSTSNASLKSIADIGNDINTVAEPEDSAVIKESLPSTAVALINANIAVPAVIPVVASPRRESLYRKMIRDYLNRALGANERVEIKLSAMKAALEITDKTLYSHLKVLRQTEFEIKKLRYCTELKRRK